MLIVGYKGIGKLALADKYKTRAIALSEAEFKDTGTEWLIEFISVIKEAVNSYELVLLTYSNEVVLSLDALKISYVVAYPAEISAKEYSENKEEYDMLRKIALNNDAIILENGETLEEALADTFDWVELNIEEPEVVVSENNEPVAEPVVEPEPEAVVEQIMVPVENQVPVINKNKLTLKELVEEDLDITEGDVRELKALTNKFKVAMLLQAKTRLNTVLKLCNVLDKLYDELVNRIDTSIGDTDTASLMYTTDYIAKALSDTNQFIMSLITSEKLQNFFIIDNSNVINISNDRVDINKREKIRKAAEIVIDNIDYFSKGQFENIVDPNEEVREEDNNANTTT